MSALKVGAKSASNGQLMKTPSVGWAAAAAKLLLLVDLLDGGAGFLDRNRASLRCRHQDETPCKCAAACMLGSGFQIGCSRCHAGYMRHAAFIGKIVPIMFGQATRHAIDGCRLGWGVRRWRNDQGLWG